MWKCPSLCDESFIQNPVIKKRDLHRVIIQIAYCPLYGKEMMFFVKNKRTTDFIIKKDSEWFTTYCNLNVRQAKSFLNKVVEAIDAVETAAECRKLLELTGEFIGKIDENKDLEIRFLIDDDGVPWMAQLKKSAEELY